MSYRKFKADNIFTGNELLDGNSVLITDENGLIENIAEEKDAGTNIEIFEGILSPGFINCHCHLELSHLKNVVESGTGLVDFLIKVISNRNEVKEEMQSAMQKADTEMYNAGIVAAGDICNTTDSIEVKQHSKIRYQNFVEVLGFIKDAETRFQNYINLYKNFCDAGFTKRTSIVPHAPYTVSDSMFNLINEFSAGKIISIHNQETLTEDELYRTKTGAFLKLYEHLNINIDFFQPYNKSSLQSYLPLLNRAKNILLVHNTFTTQQDIDFSIEQGKKTGQQISWCLCLNANLYIEKKLPPVKLFKENKLNIVLGTDSYASNYSLSILDEMKTIRKFFSSVKLKELLKWATNNGAKALNMDDKFGSFERGKKPGIINISDLSNGNISESATVKRIL